MARKPYYNTNTQWKESKMVVINTNKVDKIRMGLGAVIALHVVVHHHLPIGPGAGVSKVTEVHDFEFAEEPPCDVQSARRHLDFEND